MQPEEYKLGLNDVLTAILSISSTCQLQVMSTDLENDNHLQPMS